MSSGTEMIKKKNWPIIIFFTVTTLVALIGTPLYIRRYGISASEILLFLFYVGATGLSITVGYHRLYAHSTFKANRLVHFLVLFFGAAAYEQSALTWSSGHRDHHRYVDTPNDPYSIKKGFWYAHIGWMTLWQQRPDYTNAKDLLKDKLLMHQHRHYVAWGAVAGILLPTLIGAITGHALGGFIFSVCLRLTLVYHATFCINSVCHTFGKATYDIYATARDNWFAAVLTNGEGYHNFHHRFPTDYRNGIRWFHWDPSKWVIYLLSRLGMAWDLQKVSKFNILEAKLSAENQALSDYLIKIKDKSRVAPMKHALQTQYDSLLRNLAAWETTVKQHRALISATVSNYVELKVAALDKIKEARSEFQKSRGEWDVFTKTWMRLA